MCLRWQMTKNNDHGMGTVRMAKKAVNLTGQQGADCISRLPEAFRAAVMDISLTGLDVCREGVQTGELCHPLTKEQLAQIRACTGFTRQEMEAVHVPDDGDAFLFRVRYDVAGYDADGNAITVQAEGALGVTCCCRGGGEFREVIAITDAFPCQLREDGRVKKPGFLARRMRRWLRKKNREGVGEMVGELILEVLGALLEILLDAVFDG